MRTLAVTWLALSLAACSGGGAKPDGNATADASPRPGLITPGGGGGGLITPGSAPTPQPGDAPPAASMSLARAPGPGGWYTSAVRVDARASDDRALEEACFWIVPNYPRGTSTSSAERPCPASGKRWTGSGDLKEEARYIVQLLARDNAGQETHAANLDVLVDLTPPASSFKAPAGAFRGTVTLEGSVADASSGAARVLLVFTRDGEELRRDVTCTCPTGWRRDRPPEPFRFSGPIPPGTWTVRAIATDHAGHVESPGATVQIQVV